MPPFTRFEVATREGSLPKLKRLLLLTLQSPQTVASKHGALGCTLLHHAAAKGHHDIVVYLVETCGVTVNALNDLGQTPLHYAALAGDVVIVRYLLSKQASADVMSHTGGKTPLHVAAGRGHLATVICLVAEGGVSVVSKGSTGETPLFDACRGGHLEVVMYLVECARANGNARATNRTTPLHVACQTNHLDVVIYLVESCGADIQAVSVYLTTPMHDAAKRGYLDVVQYLVAHGKASVKVRDSNHKTPLDLAIEHEHEEVVRFLVGHQVPDGDNEVPAEPHAEEDDSTLGTVPREIDTVALQGNLTQSLSVTNNRVDSVDAKSPMATESRLQYCGEPLEHRIQNLEGLMRRLGHLEEQFLGASSKAKDSFQGATIATRLARIETAIGVNKSQQSFRTDMRLEETSRIAAVVGTAQDDLD